MKILTVNYSDSAGGASIAAYRLHKALKQSGVDSKMLVLDKKTNDPNVFAIDKRIGRLLRIISKIEDKFIKRIYPNKTTNRFSYSNSGLRIIAKKINKLNPDIVHLHWVQSGTLSSTEIPKIKKPIVWTLHDTWGFTGGCHYNESCNNFLTGCGTCKILNSEKKEDISRKNFSRKQLAFSTHGNINFIGLSNWITKLAVKSPLTKNVYNLPNPINTKDYCKKLNNEIVNSIGIDPERNNVLIGAMSLEIKRKGFQEFLDSLKYIKSDIDIVTFGKNNYHLSTSFQIINAGLISNPSEMINLYNLSSVTVVPSLEENLSNVIMESLACGTPVVAFDTGGNSDLISHKNNGYLANYQDEKDLAAGIDWVLNNKKNLSDNAINSIKENFDYSVVAKKYIDLYQSLL